MGHAKDKIKKAKKVSEARLMRQVNMKECKCQSLSYENYYKVWRCSFCEKIWDLEMWRIYRKSLTIKKKENE